MSKIMLSEQGTKKVCIDCGDPFVSHTWNRIRCSTCQDIEMAASRKRSVQARRRRIAEEKQKSAAKQGVPRVMLKRSIPRVMLDA